MIPVEVRNFLEFFGSICVLQLAAVRKVVPCIMISRSTLPRVSMEMKAICTRQL